MCSDLLRQHQELNTEIFCHFAKEDKTNIKWSDRHRYRDIDLWLGKNIFVSMNVYICVWYKWLMLDWTENAIVKIKFV